MSVAAFKAALSDRDPQVRKAVREVPDGTYTAVQLRELLQALREVRGEDFLHYAWPDCELTRQAFTPEWLSAAEFKVRLIDPDPDVRRSVWLTMHDDAFMNGVPADYFPAVMTVLGSQDHAYAWPDCRIVLEGSCLWGHPDTLELVTWVLARSTDGLRERLARIIGLPKGLYPPRWPVPITESGIVECNFCAPALFCDPNAFPTTVAGVARAFDGMETIAQRVPPTSVDPSAFGAPSAACLAFHKAWSGPPAWIQARHTPDIHPSVASSDVMSFGNSGPSTVLGFGL